MIKNYFKTAWRNIVRHRFFSIVNITGLFAGITFALLIGGYVWGEMQVNQNLRHADRQYFMTSEWKDPNMGGYITSVGPLSKRLKEDYPSLVANYYRWDGITSIITKGDKHFREGVQLGDSTLLAMYGFGLAQGNAATALSDPYSVVISKDIAKKYFGTTNVVGETLTIQSFSGGQHDFLVTGVLQDIRENSVTKLNDANQNGIFIPASAYAYFGRTSFDDWNNINLPSYIELQPGVQAKALELPISRLMQANAPDFIKQNLQVKPVALKDYYQKTNPVVKRMLYTLTLVGLFILLMAMINFINISVSSSANRMREIGVRKVLGGSKIQLIIQFLTESVILVLIATTLALIALSSTLGS